MKAITVLLHGSTSKWVQDSPNQYALQSHSHRGTKQGDWRLKSQGANVNHLHWSLLTSHQIIKQRTPINVHCVCYVSYSERSPPSHGHESV